MRATWPKEMRGLVDYARQCGWIVVEDGNKLLWSPPGSTHPAVRTPVRAIGHGIDNYIRELRGAGLPDPRQQPPAEEASDMSATAASPNGHDAQPAPPEAPHDPFMDSIAELFDEELRRRQANQSTEEAEQLRAQVAELQRQNEELRQEVAELKQRLADREAIENRLRAEAIAEAQAAVERVLGRRT